MAKYTVNHSCGHDQTHDLYGAGKDRENKLAWLENQPCTDCWKAEKREADAKLPITMTVCTNGMDTDEQGNVLAEIILTGGTLPRRDEIKALGYIWDTPRGGILDLLGGKPGKAWVKRVRVIDLANTESEIVKTLRANADQLSAIVANKITEMDLLAVQHTLNQQAAAREAEATRKAKIADIPKPARPACHPWARERHWNGRYYGKPGSWSCYADNVKYSLSDQDYADCVAYDQSIADYRAVIANIK